MERRRKRSENLIGPRATMLRLVNEEQRNADRRGSSDDDEFHPPPRRPQHPTSRAFERKQLGLDEDE